MRSSGVRAKYSRSMSPSIRFLITTGDGRNRLRSWVVTSDTSKLCCIQREKEKRNQIQFIRVKCTKNIGEILTAIFFLDFIIRTIAASISCLRSSSTLLRVSLCSGSDSPLAATVWILTLKSQANKRFD